MTTAVPLGQCLCDSLPWRHQGQLRLTAIVKASFALPAEGTMTLLPPEPLHARDQFPKGGRGGSLTAASDRVPYRGRADVVVVGHAYAEGGKPVPSRQVRLTLRLGDETLVDKTLEVTGDRSGPADEPTAFDKLPLTYERALGGIGHDDNPMGVGVASDDPRPNVLYPGDPGRVAGMGPIAASTAARRRLLDEASREGLKLEVPSLPDSMDWSFFQAAPADQQCRMLTGAETIELEGLHPQAERLIVALPKVRAAAVVFGPADRQEVELWADTLHLDVDAKRCSITWRGAVTLSDETDLDQVTLVGGVAVDGGSIELPQQAPGVDPLLGVPRKKGRKASKQDSLAGTVGLSSSQNVPGIAMPFAPGRGQSAMGEPQIRPAPRDPGAEDGVDPLLGVPRRKGRKATEEDGLTGTVGLSSSQNVAGVALPFGGGKAKAGPSPAAPPAPAPAPVPVEAPPPSSGAASPWAGGAGKATTKPSGRSPVSPTGPAAPPPSAGAASPPEQPAPLQPAAVAEVAEGPALQLLWLDPTCLGRLRIQPELVALLDAAAQQEPDLEIESYAQAGAVDNVDDYRDVLCVITGTKPQSGGELQAAIEGAIRDGNKLIPPLVVVGGQLAIAFDERLELEATADVAEALCPDDEAVGDAVQAARACLETAAARSLRATTTLAARICAAVRSAQDDDDGLVLQHDIKRSLIARRGYRRLALFGGTYLVGQLTLPTSGRSVTAYLRDTVASQLPMYDGFAARLLAEIHLPQEAESADAPALRVVAVAREV